ncbi:unnamed protein product [Rotaria sp. Silwood2]|nr:unnamed protein product [Rotaria sp. Silwood2]
MFRIDKRLVPNLRCLKITLKYDINAMELLDKLFDHDVLFSLTKFTLEGIVTGPNVVSKLLSMLCHQCSYTYIVQCQVPETLHILINGLPKLNFIIFHGVLTGENEQESKMRDLPNHCKRAYRMEDLREHTNAPILHVWLQ